ncbi:aldo/keto reductase [Buttiauxella sp. WJP83]|uniref:aldo/keto reductase n=1 Tax=Buttiauxella sp. WJP83 TaxID=2986951 RepID=UPI0022DD49F9|nr:aldo/keto reductase [Buttiauxella sp. WJP83]WBM69551.1 aldo/keto reductase [Buttiauxella sp. WJP83]
MKSRNLGNNLAVSSMGFGAMGFSEFYGEAEDEHSIDILNNAVDMGIDFFDTADFYGNGHNEALLGRFISGLSSYQRNNLKIATKCGIERTSEIGYERSINNSVDYIRRCCEASLKRLRVESIDLFYLHRVNLDTPIEESLSCLKELVQEGKIQHVGLCEVSAVTLIKAHAVYPVTALQTEYSFWTRDIENDILPTAQALGIGVVPYSPLGRGFLSGKYLSNDRFSPHDFRKMNPRFSAENISHNAGLLDILIPLTHKYHCSLAQLSLAWLLAQDSHIVPIPGTKQLSYLKENSAAVDIQLEESDLSYLNNAGHKFSVKGARYTEEGMKGINV